MSAAYDPRSTPVRDDLAAAHLRDAFRRPRYAEGVVRQTSWPAAPLSFRPDVAARLETELLMGERFTVYDEVDGWAWGQAVEDGYVGYVPAAALASEVVEPTHLVAVAATHIYPEPDLKRPALARLSMAAWVAVTDIEGGFSRLAGGQWGFSKHLVPVGQVAPDFLETAGRFLGVPYLWGGRTSDGLDCSGLLQIVLQRAGLAVPRDTDQQESAVGRALDDWGDPSEFLPGDLVFFPGHVGFVLEGGRFLHANAFDMAVAVHRLEDVLRRAEDAAAGISTVRRLATQALSKAQ